MTSYINSLDAFVDDYFNINLPDIKFTDVVEIVIIAFFIYKFLVWIKSTRAWMLFRGILVIMGFFMLAALFQMNTVLWIGEKMISAGVIALVVVFQPELRKVLESLGRRNIQNIFSIFGFGHVTEKRFEDTTVVGLVTACFEMGAVKTGALIVIENEVALTEYENTGIPLDSLLTRQLLINIFEKNTPLHDGAVIIRGDRIVSATCYLPLSDNMALSKELGTRHRAAVGVSEVSDALVIVVSEETGKVSVAKDGKIFRNLSEQELVAHIKELQHPDEEIDAEEENRKSRRREGKRL